MSAEKSFPPAPPRTLVLMRHAKSDWGDPDLPDHDRPLNRRGRRDAALMAGWLMDEVGLPDLVLCSSAARTRETARLMESAWGSRLTVCPARDLYLAPPEQILRVIRTDGGDAASLLVLGHNPGIADLVSMLCEEPREMPTSAVAVFDVDVDDWGHLRSPDQVSLRSQMRPKALSAS